MKSAFALEARASSQDSMETTILFSGTSPGKLTSCHLLLLNTLYSGLRVQTLSSVILCEDSGEEGRG